MKHVPHIVRCLRLMTDSVAPAIPPKQEAAGIYLSGFKLISQGAEAVRMCAYTFGTLAMHCMLSQPPYA